MDLSTLKWSADGLVPVVVQDRHRGDVRMVAYANREALAQTLETRDAVFYSRSRQGLWRKGETSGHTMRVAEVWTDCDRDVVLYLVDPEGPSCHTGERTCFFERLDAERAEGELGEPTWVRFERTLEARKAATSEASYTRSLLEKGAGKIGEKLREEADEAARAIAGEPDANVDSESADVLYHLVVGLLFRGRGLRDVAATLAKRFGRSGHDEKRARPAKA